MTIPDIELLAYADGLLDSEPRRKAAISASLDADPVAAERVRTYRRQSEALRRRYDARAREAVPEALLAALAQRRRYPRRRLVAIAAGLTLLVLGGGSGWLLAQRVEPVAWTARQFLDRSYVSFVRSPTVQPGNRNLARTGNFEPFHWLSNEISLKLRVPDLSGMGYAVVDKAVVDGSEGGMVRVEYAAVDGRQFSLFLRSRWDNSDPDLRTLNRDGVSITYWLDGPLASAVVSRLAPDESQRVAEQIRREMHEPDLAGPEAGTGGATRQAPTSIRATGNIAETGGNATTAGDPVAQSITN